MDVGDKGHPTAVKRGREPVALNGTPLHAPHPARRQRSTGDKHGQQQQRSRPAQKEQQRPHTSDLFYQYRSIGRYTLLATLEAKFLGRRRLD